MIQMILGYGHAEFTRTCIESIYKHTPEEEINLVVWENFSSDRLRPNDVNPQNTVLVPMDLNYGCSTAVNALLKDFGAALDQDIIYISNDHYVFPGWIKPLLANLHDLDVISPMHPYGLPGLQGILCEFLNFHEGRKAEFLDHPESKERINQFLSLIYGEDLHRFVEEKILPLPEVPSRGEFWAGCFFVHKRILPKVGLFRTDRGLACDEDALWVQDNIRGKYTEGVYGHCYIHHFQSITTNRFHLSMDHEPGAFSGGSVPALTDEGQALLSSGVQHMKSILSRD